MAITNNDVRFLFYSKKCGAAFGKTLMLGRLNLYSSKEYIAEQIAYFRNNARQISEVEFADTYSEPLFKILGAAVVDSMDFSNYENATIIHDLNKPVDADLRQKYDAIVDGGTIEHIFNFPQAITNCMNMLNVGGHFIGITPVNNLMGHGFYQFSPELYYRVFAKENGFEVVKMIITATDESGNFDNWYEVPDPANVKSRIVLTNAYPTYLMILAKKISHQELFLSPPQQSDYSFKWSVSSSDKNAVAGDSSSLKKIYNAIVPRKLRDIIYAVKNASLTKKTSTKELGSVNEEHFKKMDQL